MARYRRHSVGNSWDRDQDGPIGTAAPRAPRPVSTDELKRLYANTRRHIREYGADDFSCRHLADLGERLRERGITEVPESCAGPAPTLTQTLNRLRDALAS